MKNGWNRVRLEELTEDDSPITYGVVKPGPSGDVPFVRGGDVSEGNVLHNQLRTITSEVSQKYRRTLLRGGELLVSLVGQPGQVAVVPPGLAGANIARQVGLVRLHGDVCTDFISYFLRSPDGQTGLGTFTGGSVQQVINLGDLRKVPVPVPPLAEQRRIVGILDEAFAGIATARANAEQNLQNARALFESHLNAVFTQRGNGWVERTLGDFCSFENGDRGKNYPNKSARTATGVPFINAGHLADDGIDLAGMDFISRERFNLLGNGKIQPGDVLFCLRGSLGKFACVGDLAEGAIASSLVIVRPNETVLTEFLLAYLRSELCSRMIDRFKNGAAQPNLSARSLRNFVAPIPPISQQQGVVSKLLGLREETQRLESIYRRKLAALDELKKSLLHQAFSGEL